MQGETLVEEAILFTKIDEISSESVLSTRKMFGVTSGLKVAEFMDSTRLRL